MADRYLVTNQYFIEDVDAGVSLAGRYIDDQNFTCTGAGSFKVHVAGGLTGTLSGTNVVGTPITLVEGENIITATGAVADGVIDITAGTIKNANTTAVYSATSGGKCGASKPTDSDNTIWDANSAPSEIYLGISEPMYCAVFDGSASTNIKVFGAYPINIYGNFINGNIDWSLYEGVVKWTGAGVCTITDGGYDMPSIGSTSFTGSLTLTSALTFNDKNILWDSGDFDSGGFLVDEVGEVRITGADAKDIDIEGSTINCRLWRATGTNITMHSTGCTISTNLTPAWGGVWDVLGTEWNQGTDTWRWIDENGNTVLAPDVDTYRIWKKMGRCTLDASGNVMTGLNSRGDGIDLTGASGNVMVRIPKHYVKSVSPSANVYQWYMSPVPKTGYEIHPAFLQRGGNTVSEMFVGAYTAGIEYDGATLKLNSQTGVQPVTGDTNCIFTVAFDAGDNEPAVGDELTNGTLDGFYVVSWTVSGGSWAGNDAAGTLLLRKPGVTTCGWANDETITNVTKGNTLATVNGAPGGLSVTIGNSRTWAGNIGTGWGIENFWTMSAVQLLYYVEYADPDSQTTVGKGIINKASGTGYNGELNGDDTIDANMEANGTGTGTGTNGLTPIAYRGIENLWGNVWQFIDGYNAVDAEYRLIKRDGTGTFADTLAEGSYDVSVADPITTDGYISNILYEDVTKYAFLASVTDGLSTSYLHDSWYAHDAGETNILLAGGDWDDGVRAGVGYRISMYISSNSGQNIGARLEFIGTTSTTFVDTDDVQFAGGGLTYNNIQVAGAGEYALTVTGNNTFNEFKVDASLADKTIKFTDGTTQTIYETILDAGANAITLTKTGAGANPAINTTYYRTDETVVVTDVDITIGGVYENISGTANTKPLMELTANADLGTITVEIESETTGQVFTWTGELNTDDILLIDCENQYVTVNGVSAMSGLDGTEEFIELQPGVNRMLVGAFTGNFKLTYHERFV